MIRPPSTTAAPGFIPQELQENILKNISLEALSTCVCVCQFWRDFAKKCFDQAFRRAVETLPNEILCTFGGVEGIASLPKIPRVHDLSIYRYSSKTMTSPVMLGLDKTGKLFLNMAFLSVFPDPFYGQTQRSDRGRVTLFPNAEGIWRLCWGDDAAFKVVGDGSNIHYDNLKTMIQKKLTGVGLHDGSAGYRRYYVSV
jgi:hypothetical protein